MANNIGRHAHGLSKEMAIYMLGRAARLYRQITRHPRAKPLGQISPNMAGSLAGRAGALDGTHQTVSWMCRSAIIVQHVEHVLLRPPLPFKIQQNGWRSELLFDLICCLQYMIVNVFINEQWIMQIIAILTVHR